MKANQFHILLSAVKAIATESANVKEAKSRMQTMLDSSEWIAGEARDACELAAVALRALPWNRKEFSQPITDLVVCIESMQAAEIERAQAEAQAKLDAKDAKAAAPSEGIPHDLPAIEREISKSLDRIQSESIRVGCLLAAGKTSIGNTQDWLTWAKDKFALGKAQVYKLVKVAETFKGDSRFTGVAMRVLYCLATQASPNEVEHAAKAAKDGNLDTRWINLHVLKQAEPASPAPAPASPAAAADPIAQAHAAPAQSAEQAHAEPASAPTDIPFDVDTPSNDGDDSEPLSAPVLDVTLASLTAELTAIRMQLAESQAEVRRLTEQLTAKADRNQTTLPVLPHLRSDSMHVRLGLTDEQAKDTAFVGHRFRELAKAYAGNSEAISLLTQARESIVA